MLRNLDVNLAPLAPASSFNEAKSAIKWLESALMATPTVASPTEPFQEAIVDGVNGLLASRPEEWETCLEELLGSPASRDRLGQRARRDALSAGHRTSRPVATSTSSSGPKVSSSPMAALSPGAHDGSQWRLMNRRITSCWSPIECPPGGDRQIGLERRGRQREARSRCWRQARH